MSDAVQITSRKYRYCAADTVRVIEEYPRMQHEYVLLMQQVPCEHEVLELVYLFVKARYEHETDRGNHKAQSAHCMCMPAKIV